MNATVTTTGMAHSYNIQHTTYNMQHATCNVHTQWGSVSVQQRTRFPWVGERAVTVGGAWAGVGKGGRHKVGEGRGVDACGGLALSLLWALRAPDCDVVV
jgi:hypothetical protein